MPSDETLSGPGPEALAGRAIEILAGEVVRTMKLLGAHTLAELEPGHVTQLQRLIPRTPPVE